MTDKQIAVEVLGRLPGGASITEITEELQVVAAILQGKTDVAAGCVRPHKEVEQLLTSWAQRWKTTIPVST